MIGSVAMMLEMSFGMESEARNLWRAMQNVFAAGYTTPDLARRGRSEKKISTAEFGDRVVTELGKQPVGN
jgi:3-isopropylmalate dehydrogenase